MQDDESDEGGMMRFWMMMMVVMVIEMILPDRPNVFPHERSGKGITGANSLKEDQYWKKHKDKA